MGVQGSGRLFLKLLCLVFVVHGGFVWGHENYQSYSYNYNYNYGNDGEPEQNCYSCTFHVRGEHSAGLENCGEPFNPDGIPIVPCKGSCAEIYHESSASEYTRTRICLPYCKDVEDDYGYTRCCRGDLCNGGDGENEQVNSCYSCTFVMQSGKPTGLANCGEPFESEGIPQVQCEGSCGMIYYKETTLELEHWSRLCLPYCKDWEHEGLVYTKCCNGHLCNGNM